MKTTIKVEKNTAKKLKQMYPDESYDFTIQQLMDYYITEQKYLITSKGTSINLLFQFYPNDLTGDGKIEICTKVDDEYIPVGEHLTIREPKMLSDEENLMLLVLYSLPLSEQTEEKILKFSIGQSMTIGDDFEGYSITRVE